MYIKQTALIVILAQIGCFVPAKHATVPVKDRILSRLGRDLSFIIIQHLEFSKQAKCARCHNK